MTACGFRVFMNESYEDMKSEYIIPRSTMTIHLRKICHLLKCSKTRHLKQRMNIGEVSISNLRGVFHLYYKKS